MDDIILYGLLVSVNKTLLNGNPNYLDSITRYDKTFIHTDNLPQPFLFITQYAKGNNDKL